MDTNVLLALAVTCAPQVDPRTVQALVSVESSGNPYAIGVVGGALIRQPQHQAEAIATAKALQAAGWDFSLGLAQINVRNLQRLRLSSEQGLDPCTNLQAMQTLLGECLQRAQDVKREVEQQDLRRAISCYYSGNFTTGFEHGYVRRVALAAARLP